MHTILHTLKCNVTIASSDYKIYFKEAKNGSFPQSNRSIRFISLFYNHPFISNPIGGSIMPAPSLTRPIHILADSSASDVPCYIISPDDILAAIRENKTLFLKLLLRLDDTSSWLSKQDLLLLKLHALAVQKCKLL